jgi:thiosulfate dehydrogenase [quinone] small subunit
MAMDRASLVAVLMTLIVTGITLGLYQLNFQGFTHLTNYSKVPEYDLTGTRLYENGTLLLQVARVAGPDTYGGFIVEVQLLYPNGTTLYSWNSRLLGDIPSADIKNAIPLHPTKSDGYALVVPLGQNSTVVLQVPFHVSPGLYVVRVFDVDGQQSAYGRAFQVEVEVRS